MSEDVAIAFVSCVLAKMGDNVADVADGGAGRGGARRKSAMRLPRRVRKPKAESSGLSDCKCGRLGGGEVPRGREGMFAP